MTSTIGTLSSLLEFLGEIHRQAWKDIRSRWRRGVFVLLYSSLYFCLGIIHFSPYVPSLLYEDIESHERYEAADPVPVCLPDGSFDVRAGVFNYWSSSGFFQITLGFGRLTFTQAKIIDVAWDLVFGRGGQALLGYISFRVFALYVTTSMETTPITFHMYRTIFIQQQTFILDIPRIIRDFVFRTAGLSSNLAMILTTCVMIFIIAFPTLGSAMTGYSGNVKSFVRDYEDNFIPFSKFELAFFEIHDGERIGLSKDFMVTSGGKSFTDVSSSMIMSIDQSESAPILPLDNDQTDLTCGYSEKTSQCYLLRNISYYAGYYGLNGQQQITSFHAGETLEPPTLNISAFYLPGFLQRNLTDIESLRDPTRAVWTRAEQTFTFAYVAENGKCQTEEDFLWGFSYIQLNLIIFFLIIWMTGLAIIWLKAHQIMKKRGHEHVAGEHKAVLELSNAMVLQLRKDEEVGEKDLLTQTERFIQHCISQDLQGGRILYGSSLAANELLGDSRFGLLRFLRREAWWLIFLLVTMRSTIAVGLLGLFWLIIAPLITMLVVLFAITVGTTGRSRAVICFWGIRGFAVLLQVLVNMVGMFTMGRNR